MGHIQATGFYMIHPVLFKYGLLYNYYAVAYNTGGASIAPAGWHVLSKTEYDTMAATLGGYDGLSEKLREVGTNFWNNPNTGATNSSGFTGRGGGYRHPTTGVFAGKGFYSYYMTTTAPYGVYMLEVLRSNSEQMIQYDKRNGASVRIIKDDSTDPGSVIDYDGNEYPTIKIGDQVITKYNLAVTHYNDGTPISEIIDNAAWAALSTEGMCAYNNDWDNV